jgi:predicted DCC family thiol-disulfide oxidoreductase YuxK
MPMRGEEPYSYRHDPGVPAFPDDKPVFFFDGVCVLCSGFGDFILRHDTKRRFRIATAQSPLGQAIFTHYGLPTRDYTTNLLLLDGRPLTKSDAFIAVMVRLPFPWPLFAFLAVAPRWFRDMVYGPIARNRYRWFGQHAACRLPTPEETDRFL